MVVWGKVGVRSGGEWGCHRAIMPSFHVQRKMWGTGVIELYDLAIPRFS